MTTAERLEAKLNDMQQRADSLKTSDEIRNNLSRFILGYVICMVDNMSMKVTMDPVTREWSVEEDKEPLTSR